MAHEPEHKEIFTHPLLTFTRDWAQPMANALEHLAELIHCIRPEWNTPGIRASLNANPNRSLHQTIRAAVDAAYDPQARTPGVIPSRQGDGWVVDRTARPQPPAFALDWQTGEPASEQVAAHAAAARKALHKEQP